MRSKNGMTDMTEPKVTSLDITYQSLVRVVVVVAVVAAAYYLRQILAVLLFAVVIASGIEPGVKLLKRYRVPRLVAVLLIYLVTIGAVIGVIYLILPSLVDEVSSFLDSFPRYQRVLLEQVRSLQGLPFYSAFSQNAESIILNPPLDITSVGGGTLALAASLFGGAASAIILIVVSFYLASQEKGIERFLRLVTPLRNEEYVIDLWTRSQTKIGQWLRGQLLLGAIVGFLVFLALTILGIRFALMLGILAAIFELVPIIGPILAAVPAVFFGFLVSPLLGLTVAIVFTLIQQTESHLLVPIVMHKAIGLNPLVIIISLLVGAKLGGILGMFLAVPMSAIIVEFLMDTDRKKRGLFHSGAPS